MQIFDKGFFYEKLIAKSNLHDLNNVRDVYYRKFNIVINNKKRSIATVLEGTTLYKLQFRLKNNYLDKLPLPDCVIGYRKGKSYRDFLVPHVKLDKNDRFFVRLDIKSFFDSINEDVIKEALQDYVKIAGEEDRNRVISDIIDICTLEGKLPQGALTSPALSNICFKRLDLRIRSYCRKLGYTYTRYVDDLLFSSTDLSLIKPKFIQMIKLILSDYGMKLNHRKIIQTKNLISLNGFVISDEIRISKSKMNHLLSLLFCIEQNLKSRNLAELLEKLNQIRQRDGKRDFLTVDDVMEFLSGSRAYLIAWNSSDSSAWKVKCTKFILRIERQLVSLDKKHGQELRGVNFY
ncbi:reverse transcriptase family protein [Listeria booriae]|uniref:reverse transcriptase family protein n=1 Tax=Listeria booriae TaxID=1552123 RepID=UPI00162AEA9F|nr:reverse transcriptase family protein [Listeria booriae]MBC2676317.1 RNA-directed DNA polymerase [Listeria booriae]